MATARKKTSGWPAGRPSNGASSGGEAKAGGMRLHCGPVHVASAKATGTGPSPVGPGDDYVPTAAAIMRFHYGAGGPHTGA